MAQYFIKRNDRVKGPFSSTQVKSAVESKNLAATDFLGTSEAGPWRPLSDYFRMNEAVQNQPAAKRQKSPEPDSASSDAQTVFVKRGDAVHGPLTFKAVQDGIAAGKIDRSDQIGPEKTGPWKEAGSLSKLFPTDEVVSGVFEGFATDDVEILDEWDQLAEDEQFSDAYQPSHRQPVAAARSAPGSTAMAGQGTLYFKRNTGVTGGALLKIKVFVDGQVKAKLAVTQSAQVVVSTGQHKIEVKGGGAFRGAKTTVSVTAGSSFQYSIKYSALGTLKLIPLASSGDSADDEEGVSLGEVVDFVDGASALLDLFEDD